MLKKAYSKGMNQFEFIIYPTKMHNATELENKLRDWIAKNAFQWVIATHEPYQSKEYSNELHKHFYIKTHSNWTLPNLAKSLAVEDNQIQKIGKSWKSAILYARHINKAPKPLIPSEKVETNIEEYGKICEEAINKGYPEPAKKLGRPKKCVPEAIIDYAENRISYSKLQEQLSFLQFNEYKRDIDNARIYRIKKGVKREMKVIYITGEAGSGKTTLAKFMGENLGYDVFISGSGADPLDGYDNEECIVLDDLRADTFTKAELFKLLDNNTNSSVKSRYFNKAITSCKLLIITSIKTPDDLYSWTGEDEPFTQLARRLGYNYLNVYATGDIFQVAYDAEDPKHGKYKATPAPFKMDFVYNYLGIQKTLGPTICDIMKLAQSNARSELEKKGVK